jgi:hypothetical protein
LNLAGKLQKCKETDTLRVKTCKKIKNFLGFFTSLWDFVFGESIENIYYEQVRAAASFLLIINHSKKHITRIKVFHA